MKRILGCSAAAAALLLAACDTYGYNDPYGAPAPYPSDPYGYPDDPYPPQSYPPPGSAPPSAPACPITASRDWRAWINAMPGPEAPKLHVTGIVVTPTLGYRLEFEPIQVRESYPAQAFVTLRPVPPSGPAGQALETHEVRWEWPVRQEIGSVIVRCGERTLAEISPVQRAY